jgi:hypothetical protein
MKRLAFVLAAAAIGCGTSDGSGKEPPDLFTIANQPAQGTIASMPFTLGTRFMNKSGTDLNVDLLHEVAADCTKDETTAAPPFVIFFVPAAPGRYELSLDTHTVTFVDKPSSNLIIDRGVVQIDAISATQVTGGLHVFNAEFGELNGRIDGKLCFSN